MECSQAFGECACSTEYYNLLSCSASGVVQDPGFLMQGKANASLFSPALSALPRWSESFFTPQPDSRRVMALFLYKSLLAGRGAYRESDSSWGLSWLAQRLRYALEPPTIRRTELFPPCGWSKMAPLEVFSWSNSPLETFCRAKILGRDGRARCRESLFLRTGNRLLEAVDGARLGSATPPNNPPTSVMIEPVAFRGRSDSAYGGHQGMSSA